MLGKDCSQFGVFVCLIRGPGAFEFRLGFEKFQHPLRAARAGVLHPKLGGSFDEYGDSGRDSLDEPRDVPVGDAHATMTMGPPDGFGIIGAVDADPRSVQCAPSHPHGVVGSRWEQEKIRRAHPTVQHPLIPAEYRHRRDGKQAPLSWGGGQVCRAGRDWRRGQQRFVVTQFQYPLLPVDVDSARLKLWMFRQRS